MMSTSPSPAASPAPVRALRYLVRVPMLLWHLLIHLPILLVILLSPLGDRRLRSGEHLGHRMIRWWQGGLMRVFGFRMRRAGQPLSGAALLVANHVSWVDIVAMHSQRMVGFVAKREIASWPVVGWLAARGETIFHQRGSQASMGGVLEEMLERLRHDRPVAVFPEGRTRDGSEVGPFHARIFLAAVEAGVPVQPVALRYGEHGSAQTLVAFREGESFFANFVRLLGERGGVADVVFLEPLHPEDTDGRRRLAEESRARIVAALGQDR